MEVTESAVSEDVDLATRHLEDLRRLGVRIAIDDFGTGRASLAYLDRFAVDAVKLDRSFLVRATTNSRTQRVLHGVVRVLCGLKVEIIAEGLETEDQLRLLREVGVNLGQGFLLGRPAPALDAEQLLSTHSRTR